MKSLEDVLDHLGELPTCWKGKKHYYDIPASFDIETTNYVENGVKKACMYTWSFCICGWCVTGRTWEEWLECLDILHKRLDTNDQKILIIYVHNLDFEFQWMRKWLEWEAVFALDQRRPCYARTKTGIEFRCSYILSGASLEYVGNNLQKYQIRKLLDCCQQVAVVYGPDAAEDFLKDLQRHVVSSVAYYGKDESDFLECVL